jgi:hypothetical protein
MRDEMRVETLAERPVDEGGNGYLWARLDRAAQGHADAGADVAPIRALLDQGCDLEADVLPTVARTVPELPRPLKNWGAPWLVREILAAREQRLAGRAVCEETQTDNNACTVDRRTSALGWVRSVTKSREPLAHIPRRGFPLCQQIAELRWRLVGDAHVDPGTGRRAETELARKSQHVARRVARDLHQRIDLRIAIRPFDQQGARYLVLLAHLRERLLGRPPAGIGDAIGREQMNVEDALERRVGPI